MVENESIKYRSYRIRWFQLFIYFSVTFSNAIISMTFVPIVDQTSKYFEISVTQVNLLTMIFMFLYPIGSILSMYCYRSLTIRWGMIIGSLLNLGIFIRLVTFLQPTNSYFALIVGQICPALAAPFFLNSVTFFSARWFPSSQRDIATAIGSMANPLGTAVGSLIPSIIVTDKPTSNQFLKLLLSESILIGVTTISIILFFKSSPPTPPSASEKQDKAIHLKNDLHHLLTNQHYLILLFGFSLGLALMNAFTSVLEQLIEPFGYSSEDAGIFGALMILIGLCNTFLVGFLMDRTHAYRSILKILVVGAFLSTLFFILMLRPNRFYPLAVSIGLMGFFFLPILPVTYECAVESTYPIHAEWSTALFGCLGNIFGALFIYLVAYLVKLDPILKSSVILTPASFFIIITITISGLSLFFYRGPYLRLESEKISDEISNLNE